MLRATVRILLHAGLVVVLFWAGLALFQDRLLYLPTLASMPEMLADVRSHRLVPWPDEGGFRGLLREPAGGDARATVVLFHGNAGHAGHRHEYAQSLAALGLRVILAEYPGYGPRPGTHGEAALLADAIETVVRARQAYPGPLLLAGESLGAALAAASATAVQADAVLLITPWDRLENVARHHYPWVPVGWLLRDRYDNQVHLAHYAGRVAMVLAGADSIVPTALGQALFAELAEPKRLWIVPAADHNDWLGHVDGNWWQEVIAFLLPEWP